MNTSQSKTIIESLDVLLERERQALIGGHLDAVPDILSRKETLLSRLSAQSGFQAKHLTHLRDKVSRNQILLESALRGIHEVADRISTLRRAQRSLETYDSAGGKTVIVTRPEHKMERRA